MDYSDVTSLELLGWREGWQWRLAEAEGYAHDEEVCELYLEEIGQELQRRQRLRGRAKAPPWPAFTSNRDRFIRIKATVRLEDYARTYGPLYRERVDKHKIWACCPLRDHKDLTPSFKIDTERQRWHCFGCNRFGDVIDLAGHIEGLTQVADVCERLELLYGMVDEGRETVATGPGYSMEGADGQMVSLSIPVIHYRQSRHR